MKNTIPKPRIVIDFDHEHIALLDRARRKEGLSRTSFARALLLRTIAAIEASSPARSGVAR